jgi:nucleotide-binding universal stress UspA family protein
VGRNCHNGPVSSPEYDFEIGTDGPTLIMAGLDGSRTSMRAAAYAAGLARRQNCRLLAVYVGHLPAGASMSAGAAVAMAETSRQVAADLEETVLHRAAEAGMDAEFRAVSGDPFTELTRIATAERADAVVVGTSEHAGHRVVGSLATRLVRAGKWPVIVVP